MANSKVFFCSTVLVYHFIYFFLVLLKKKVTSVFGVGSDIGSDAVSDIGSDICSDPLPNHHVLYHVKIWERGRRFLEYIYIVHLCTYCAVRHKGCRFYWYTYRIQSASQHCRCSSKQPKRAAYGVVVVKGY